jgi:hypothetical protein
MNDKGQPTASQQVASFDLRPRETLGFNWVVDRAKMYEPNAHPNLQAYAGGHRLDLGGITSPYERYYWADASAWSAYWSGQQGRNVSKKLMLQ